MRVPASIADCIRSRVASTRAHGKLGPMRHGGGDRGRATEAEAWTSGRCWLREEGALDLWSIDLEVARARSSDQAVLSDAERARRDRLLVPEKARQFALARAALRDILSLYAGQEPSCLALATGEHGKPLLVGRPEIVFNLSHSGNRALLGVVLTARSKPVRLGVDVEEIRGRRPLDGIAKRFFAAAEHAVYRQASDAGRVALFYRAWTRKEAYLKAWGTGLTFSSRRFVVDLEPGPGRHLLSTEMPGDDEVEKWWFGDLRSVTGYAAAYCLEGDDRGVRRWLHGAG